MLSKPKNGWTTVQIKDFEVIASYLVDIPFDWLYSCLNGLKNRTPICLFIDEEGAESYIVSYYDVTHVIYDGDEVERYTFRDIDFMDITHYILEDIKRFYDDWLSWSPYEDSEEDIIVRNEKLKRLIDEVEYELEKEAKRYNKSFLRSNNE